MEINTILQVVGMVMDGVTTMLMLILMISGVVEKVGANMVQALILLQVGTYQQEVQDIQIK